MHIGRRLSACPAEGCQRLHKLPISAGFQGAVLESCDAKDDDTANFVVGGVWKTIEGQKNYVLYDIPEAASSAQVARKQP